MGIEPRNQSEQETAEVPRRIRPALQVLCEAIQYAKQTGSERWEFAVEIAQLTALGLTANDFRWLVRKGLVEHQREITLDGSKGRSFQPTGDLKYTATSCFILTDQGISITRESSGIETSALDSSLSPTTQIISEPTISKKFSNNGNGLDVKLNVPTWNPEKRELSLNGVLVKRYKWKAINQETILSTFEDDRWPHRIDDPLPQQLDHDPKRKLSDTIRCLNRKQVNKLLQFHGDGTGQGVTWELSQQNGKPL